MSNVSCEGLAFPEGPAFDREGNLYVVEIAAGQVSRISPDGKREVFAKTGGGPNGSNFGPDGNLYVTNNGGFLYEDGRMMGRDPDSEGGRIERISPDGRVERVYTEYEGEQLSACNDLAFDPEGNFYFTDPGHSTKEFKFPGRVYYASPDGKFLRMVDTDYRFSNGIGVSPDGRTLLVAETMKSRLWAYDITAPGVVENKRVFGNLPAGMWPDGFCFDSEGNVICAAATGGRLIVFSPDGEDIEHIEVDDPMVTNVAFGGPSFSTLYVTESGLGRVTTHEWRRPGMVLFPDRK